MLLLTVKKSEFIAHLSARVKIHTAREKELAGHLVELRKIATKIRKDMKDADRRAQRVLRVKGREYRTIFACGIAGSFGPAGMEGPQGESGSPGPQGPAGYMDFTNESELLGKLESKEREFERERAALIARVRKFTFYREHLPADAYELNVEEVSMLEFA